MPLMLVDVHRVAYNSSEIPKNGVINYREVYDIGVWGLKIIHGGDRSVSGDKAIAGALTGQANVEKKEIFY